MKTINIEQCSICLDSYTGHGHNAQPVNDGRCCDVCNDATVIPARLMAIAGRDHRKQILGLYTVIDPNKDDVKASGLLAVESAIGSIENISGLLIRYIVEVAKGDVNKAMDWALGNMSREWLSRESSIPESDIKPLIESIVFIACNVAVAQLLDTGQVGLADEEEPTTEVMN